MAALVGRYAAKKLLNKEMRKRLDRDPGGKNDPYFLYVAGANGTQKKVKRTIPDYVPENDAMILARARKLAYRLDCGLFELFGIRFGWESVYGLIPFVGDAIGLIMALQVYKQCKKVEGGLSTMIKIQMLFNILVDFLIGLIPFLGDLLDAYFKANSKNVMLLTNSLEKKYAPKTMTKTEKEAANYEDITAEDRKEAPPLEEQKANWSFMGKRKRTVDVERGGAAQGAASELASPQGSSTTPAAAAKSTESAPSTEAH